jgi:acyl-CoA synthetase (AMP-forming)/AMP-acid ligase II
MSLTMSHAVGPDQPELRDLTLGGLLAWAAETTPDRVALIAGVADPAGRRQWTYAELYAESVRTAHALLRRFEPGERVAVWAPNIPEWVMMEFGAALAGLVLVTVNPAFREHEVEYVLTQSRAAGIAVCTEFRGNPMLATVEEVRSRCTELREVIRFDQWDAFIEEGAVPVRELPIVAPRDAVMIQYTSGTTGFPKGALLHHRGLVNNGAHTLDRIGVRDGAVTITMMPLFHTGGCAMCVLGAISKRATQVLVEAFDPALVLELIETFRCEAASTVPTMLVAMSEQPAFTTGDLSSMQRISCGASSVPASLVTIFTERLGVTCTILFGQTECSPVATATYPNDTPADMAGTIGGPMPHVEVKVVDPVSGLTQPIGAIGELCTRGYHVMHGYFENPDATAAAIDADGWLHTGDLCAMDHRGYCTIEGRLKDMIIRGGENIYPRELEELLYAHPKVGEVAVVGLPDEKWGEEVAAFIRPATGERIDKSELFAYMRQHLAPHKTPRHWFEVDVFPLTGPGKIQKYKLREMSANGTLTEL